MDTIHIRQLALECIIGVDARERELAQDVILSISLHGDFREAGAHDRLRDAVDYAALRTKIIALVEASRFQLLEALAQAVADVCLAEKRVTAVDVVVEKPGAFSGHGIVAVEIHRTRT